MKVYAVVVGAVGSLLISANGFAGVTELVTNGSFESPVVNPFQQFPSGISGWTGSAGVEVQANGSLGAGQNTPFGNQYAELAVEGPSTYSQTIATVPGQQYDFSFYLAARPGTGPNTVSVAFTGNPSATFTAADTPTVNFQRFTDTFTATAAQSTLSLSLVTPTSGGGGGLVDNVSLSTGSGSPATAVPLPAAFWTGLSGLLGIVAVGFGRRALSPG